MLIKKTISILIMIGAIYWSFSSLMPNTISDIDTPEHSFSTQRALLQLKEISKKEHYLGSDNHSEVRNYLLKELEKLGLEPQTQEAYSINETGEFTKPINILAKIKGVDNSKALLLMSHYDSEPHSSFGASDAGSGIVTILEGIRAFISEGHRPKNDIIILFTDAEELGLNGAEIFVNKHPWAKDVGLAINFEARGSGGPATMFLETNKGNANIIEGFIKANPQFPVTSSLYYSFYKMVPNDTDLTPFREQGDIDGLFFAFFDDHYDYHTALDNYERLDRNTLEQQGNNVMAMLNYFSDTNLNNLKSAEDKIYFNVPLFKMVSYPFSWITPMLIIALLMLIYLTYLGIKKDRFNIKAISIGFVPFLGALILNCVIGYFAWPFLKTLYPHYGEVLQGFTYNGHYYIAMLAFLAIGICLFVYHKFYKVKNAASLLIAPIIFWILLCIGFALKLKGASFFILPVFFALLSLWVLIKSNKHRMISVSILGIPVLVMLSSYVKMFPVGLGLDTLIATTLVVTLIFGLLIGVIAQFKHKNRWSYLFFTLALICFISAHFKSGFNENRPKPNSLVYSADLDDNSTSWNTYDRILDSWTETFLSDNPTDQELKTTSSFVSKYNTNFKYSKKTDLRAIPQPEVNILLDTIIGDNRKVTLYILPHRKVHRFDVVSDTLNNFKSFKINSVDVKKSEDGFAFKNRSSNRLFQYYVSDDQFLEMTFEIPKNQKTTFQVFETSFDLLNHPSFNIPERPKSMIPKPFVINDAIMQKLTITVD